MGKIKNIPPEIYLQIGAGAAECGDFAALTSSDVTWHTERIFANDIRYVLPKDVKTNARKKIYISEGLIAQIQTEKADKDILKKAFRYIQRVISNEVNYRECSGVFLVNASLLDDTYWTEGEASKGAKL
ncbi:hypothetical protein [Alloprevotella tannerae]